MEKPVMNYPKCPSCGNELLDRTDQCPFCGSDLSRRSLRSAGAQTNHIRKIIVLVSVMMAISGIAFTFFFAINAKRNTTGTEKMPEQVIPQDANAEHCFENMYRILDTEDDYMDQNGRYADNIDELHQFDSALDLVCPQGGLPYSIINTKQSVQVICSVHGEV
ncbi:MAG: zinc ribbon domain-containing protein [Candidatus Aegiribacteria sp.]|nr:zinc ribbon domain-containing protein [Candidatus Aegiribacteria sp.]